MNRLIDENNPSLSIEEYYDQYIAPKYIKNYASQHHNICESHEYNFPESKRTYLLNHHIYSIDPPGCLDADDAFSLICENDEMCLYIHIADPTQFIDLKSSEWSKIKDNMTTRYPSNRLPKHMMSQEIIDFSSLQQNQCGNIKNAISIRFVIDKETFLPKSNITHMFSKILVDKSRTLSYNEVDASNCPIIETLLQIAKALQFRRCNNTIGNKFSELNCLYVSFQNDLPYLMKDSTHVKAIKNMIAEFAILSNSYIASYMKVYCGDLSIFRHCEVDDSFHEKYKNIPQNELLTQIALDGICANYIKNKSNHDLVGSEHYCHFTSPIRRCVDCVVHYILKYIYFKYVAKRNYRFPFSSQELDNICCKSNTISKYLKKLQFDDHKFRFLHALYLQFQHRNFTTLHMIQYKIQSITNGFCNIIITQLDQDAIYMSYTLKIVNYPYTLSNDNYDSIDTNVLRQCVITHVNPCHRFDEGKIPELDTQIFSLLL